MREMSSTGWLRRGSSIVFDKEALGPLINEGALISIREALGWMNAWPATFPGSSRTVLVGGLETLLEVLTGEEAEQFLRERVKPLILEFQAKWDSCGLVFGFGTHERAFEITSSDEEVIFRRGDREQIRLSHYLWDGSATLDVTRLTRESADGGRIITVGYYVPRIS